MPAYLRYAATAAIVAIVGVGVLAFNARSPGVGTETPIPTVAPTGSPAPTAVYCTAPSSLCVLPLLDTANWTPYTSSRYGYRIAYPPTDWTAIPGDHDWTFENDIDAFSSTAPDRFETQGTGEGLGIRLSIWTDNLEPGTTQQDWISTYCAAAYPAGSCTEPTNLVSEVMPGGPYRILGWNNPAGEPMAAFVRDETIYILAIWRSKDDPSVRPWGGSQRLLQAFITTITLPGVPSLESPAAS